MFKISVIIPVYNTEQYLEACLDSVFGQTLEEIEVILVNDGSIDSSLKIMEKYQARYPDKVKLLSKENGGQATARNMAIPLCTGEYIGFVDSDDYIEPEMYEGMYRKAKETDADYVECDYVNVKVNDRGEQERIADYGSRVREYTSKEDMFIDPMLAPWNKIYKRTLLQGSDVRFPEGYIYEDTAFCLKAISLVQRFTFVPEKYVVHYFRGGSTMNVNKSKRVSNIFPVLKDVISFYQKHDLFETYHPELEYEIVKILLCSSMVRISEIPDKQLRKQYCKDTWAMIEEHFPKYKKNIYLKQKGMKNLYMKCVCGWNIALFCKLFGLRRQEV